MARRIAHPRSVAERSPRTDWSQWADGGWVRLKRGEDFPQTPEQALRAIRSWGSRHGYAVSGTKSGPETIDIKIS